MLVLSPGMAFVRIELILGNNYGLGDTRKQELLGACQILGVTREDRCVVLDYEYTP